MSIFRYTQVTTGFLDRLAEDLGKGESAVLLGPRHSGKRYVLQKLVGRLQAMNRGAVVSIWDLASRENTEERRLCALIRRAVSATEGGGHVPGEETDEFFSPIDWLIKATGKPVFLVAANVDGMAHHLARRFLQAIRKRESEKTLVVLLSGEFHFRELVHGKTSEFNASHHYVVQGVDEEIFLDFFQRYCKALNLEPDCSRAASRRAWELTGGSIYLLRLVLAQVVEGRARGDEMANRPLSAENLPLPPMVGGTPLADSDYILRHAARLISREPETSLPQLEELIKAGENGIPATDVMPGPLEFAGVAIRDPSGRLIRLASPMMVKLVENYYDLRRLADLYAFSNEWTEAFRRYGQLPQRERLRPTDTDDRVEVDGLVTALCSLMASEVNLGEDHLRDRFASGCRYLLGFPDVSFWKKAGAWKLVGAKEDCHDEIRKAMPSLLPSSEPLPSGIVPLPEEFDAYAVAAILPAVRSGEHGAVIVGDFRDRLPISKERFRLVNRLLERFVNATTQMVRAEADRRRLEARNKHVAIVNSILDSLARRVLEVKHVLEMAARGLRDLGYHRVEICFVDPKRERIRGVVDISDDPTVDVAKMTDYPLLEPRADIQPYVIRTREPKVVPDPHLEPLISKLVLRQAKLRPLAIVPILDRGGEAVGTIHVERLDGLVPSQEEVDDLMSFGHQLAAAAEESEHVRLLQTAVDKMPSPVVLVDLKCKPLYANRQATRLLPVGSGWLENKDAKPLTEHLSEDLRQAMERSLSEDHPSAIHRLGIGTDSAYRGTVVLDRILNWQGEEVAGLLHVQDLNYLETIFEAISKLAQANDFQSARTLFARACLDLGPKWARLYVVSEKDPTVLVSQLWEGEGDSERKRRFNEGGLELFQDSEPPSAWRCLLDKKPLVFCCLPDGSAGQVVYTRRGVSAIVVPEPTKTDLFDKNSGDFWIDFPLFTQEGNVGKLTLECPPDFPPENFELLKILSEHASALLGAFVRRQRIVHEEKEYLSRDVAERIIGTTAHNLATSFERIPFLLDRLASIERKFSDAPEIRMLHDRLREWFRTNVTTVLRAQELLIVPVRLEKADLTAVIERALQSLMPENSWTFHSPRQPVTAMVYSDGISRALAEMVRNSREARTEGSHVTVSLAEFSQRDADWVRITYEDNGPGVPDEHKGKIFGEFYSFHPSGKLGTGLGLYYIDRVVRGHGGSISETGVPDEGAKFVIELPKNQVER